MPLHSFDSWASQRVAQTSSLSTLKDAVVGIDAAYYLSQRINGSPEDDTTFKHALGGVPFNLKQQVNEDINSLLEAGAKPIFIFNGVDHVNKPTPEYLSQESMKAASDAWKRYNDGKKDGGSNDFLKAKYPVQTLDRWLQHQLTKSKVDYLVAPYSSIAQLSYMEQLSEQYIDCIWGSTDYFLFNIDKVITNIAVRLPDTQAETFTWVSRATCVERLKVTTDSLRDAQLLLGSAFSPTFPPLARQAASTKGVGITDVIAMLNSNGRNVLQLCHAYRDDPSMANNDYADLYKRAIMSIRHHIALRQNGTIESTHAEYAPGDVHDFVGQNLPAEMFFYLSRGIIGPEVLNWLTQDHIDLTLPPGVMDSPASRSLVFEQLNPVRAQALMVLSENMNIYYRHRKVRINTWAGQERPDLTINMREETLLKDTISGWKVKDGLLQDIGQDFSLLACLQALKKDKFRLETVKSGKTTHAYPALTSTDEVIANTFYRFLRIRGYVNEKHELTVWGNVLETILAKLSPPKRASDMGSNDIAILAVELMRFGLLNGDESGGPRPSGPDLPQDVQASINLASKIACLDRLPHQPFGYIGYLNQQLFSFSWNVAAIRSTLRILMESILVAMFLSGEVQRDRDDWTAISERLPLRNDQGCSLGVVASSYLKEVATETGSAADVVKDKIKTGHAEYQKWFTNAKDRKQGLGKRIDRIHAMWSVVYEGSQVAGQENKNQKAFEEAKAVLEPLW